MDDVLKGLCSKEGLDLFSKEMVALLQVTLNPDKYHTERYALIPLAKYEEMVKKLGEVLEIVKDLDDSMNAEQLNWKTQPTYEKLVKIKAIMVEEHSV